MRLKFTIHGEPMGKGRPRFTKNGDFVKAYTPAGTVSYENLVKLEFLRQCGNKAFSKNVPIDMRIMAYFAIPARTSNKRKNLMRNKLIRPTKKPDADNIIKIISDALNKVAYYDDSQIADTAARKFYSDNPRVEVTITEVSQ